jgi:uncharacterized protein YggE
MKFVYKYLNIILLLLIFTILNLFITLYYNKTPNSSLEVVEVASKKVQSDIAKLYGSINLEGENLDTLNTQLDNKILEIKNFLKNSNFSEEDIYITKNAYQNYNNYAPDSTQNTSRPSFQQSAQIEITFQDLQSNLNNPNEILKKIIDLGVNNYSSFEYKISENNINQFCSNLESDSYNIAKEKIDNRILSQKGKLISISVSYDKNMCQSQNQGIYPYADIPQKQIATTDNSQDLIILNPKEIDLKVSTKIIAEYRI